MSCSAEACWDSAGGEVAWSSSGVVVMTVARVAADTGVV